MQDRREHGLEVLHIGSLESEARDLVSHGLDGILTARVQKKKPDTLRPVSLLEPSQRRAIATGNRTQNAAKSNHEAVLPTRIAQARRFPVEILEREIRYELTEPRARQLDKLSRRITERPLGEHGPRQGRQGQQARSHGDTSDSNRHKYPFRQDPILRTPPIGSPIVGN